MQFNWSVPSNFTELWLLGVWHTLLLSLVVVVNGTLIGAALVIGQMARRRWIRYGTRAVINLMRSLPALVLIGTIYFCLPPLTGLRFSAAATACLALSINLAPFAAECIRGGIESVPTLQYESARSLGFQGWQLYYYIIGPQALRRVLPSLVGEWVTSIKLTSLAATIGVPELWNVTSQVVAATALPVEARIIGAALYAAIILPGLWLTTWLEQRFIVRGLGETVGSRVVTQH